MSDFKRKNERRKNHDRPSGEFDRKNTALNDEVAPLTIEGRNAVTEALKSGRPVDRIFVLDGCQDGPVNTIKREAKKRGVQIRFVPKERLDQMSETGRHQGVIAYVAVYEYAQVSDLLQAARDKGEDPFVILLDGIEDPHNLGAIIRTANLAGAHGVIIPKNRAVGLTATVAKASAGAINYTPVAKVTNLTNELLQKNAEALHQASVETAKESERGVVDIETLKKTNADLIQTLDDVLKIQQEGKAKRRAAEQEMARMEQDLKKKLLEIQH